MDPDIGGPKINGSDQIRILIPDNYPWAGFKDEIVRELINGRVFRLPEDNYSYSMYNRNHGNYIIR